MTLSAPKTNRSGFALLTLTDFISARFFEIDNGFAPSAKESLLFHPHLHLKL